MKGLLLVLFLAVPGVTAEAGQEPAGIWGEAGPGHVWVFIASVLQWPQGSAYASYAPENRRDDHLVRFFVEDLGVPADHVVRFQDSAARLDALRAGLRGLLSRTGEGDTLFFYYAGHGAREEPGVTSFVPYDAEASSQAWAVPDIIADVEADFRGRRVILAADCCHSGGLCLEAGKSGRRLSYACLASAQSSSPSTGEWTFTDVLLRGMTGSSLPDGDKDGRVLFRELADHLEDELAFIESQLPASAANGLIGPQTLVSAVRRTEPAASRVMVRWKDGQTYRGQAWGSCAAPQGEPGRRVRFAGYPEAQEECAPEDSIKPFSFPRRRYRTGQRLFVSWDGAWYKARVLGHRLGLYRIRYEGWSGYWDEWVSPDRMAEHPPRPASVMAPAATIDR